MQADEALDKLKHGNANFQRATAQGQGLVKKVRAEDMGRAQQPFAIILGCSDSRVPAELVFDQGLGDLFVIRVAGNIVAPSQIGSIEFACQQFGTQLVVVLGHTQCGAVIATVDSLLNNPDDISPNIASIVKRVEPAVAPLLEGNSAPERDSVIASAGRANVQQSVQGLQARSDIIRQLIADSKLKIVGAEYDLESGKVDFFLP